MGGKNAKVHNKTGCGYRYMPLMMWPKVFAMQSIITTFHSVPSFFPILNNNNNKIFNYPPHQSVPLHQPLSLSLPQPATALLLKQPIKMNPMNNLFNTSGKLMIRNQNGVILNYKW